MNRLCKPGLALAALVAGAALQSSGAEAQYLHRRPDPGAAIAGGVVGGVVGGLAAGAILNSARPQPRYGEVYYGPRYVPSAAPVYEGPEPACWIERRKVWIDPYAWTFRHVRVCG